MKKKVLAACGVVGAFGLGWIISDRYTCHCIALGLKKMKEDGYFKIGETIDGVFNELTPEEYASRLKDHYNLK